jgi:flagellar hook-associated protein FlgK
MNIIPSIKRSVRGTTALSLALALGLTFVAACSKSASTPTAALKAYFEAAKKKDIATAKKYLSSATLKMMEDLAKAQGKTLDQMFSENAAKEGQMPTPEFSNEKINGDTATVDMKVPNQPMVTAQMVKEGGDWKLAIDKMMNAMKSQMPEPPKAPPMEPKESNSSESGKEDEKSNDKETENENDHNHH